MLCSRDAARPIFALGRQSRSHIGRQGDFGAMALRLLGHIELPENRAKGGFDHADIHAPADRLYVAHTSNDAIDIIDIIPDRTLNRYQNSREWQVRSCLKRAASCSRPIEARILSRCLRQVQSGMPSRS